MPFEEEMNRELARQQDLYEESVGQVVDACRELLDEDDLLILWESADRAEALGNAFSLLLAVGIEDPEQFLIEKGVLDQPTLYRRARRWVAWKVGSYGARIKKARGEPEA